ncbi:MAG: DUF3024 domain-containing protein [Acidimicrobiales bacterium]
MQAWTLHRADRNSSWRRYDELEPGRVVGLLAEIDTDPNCTFWG